MATSGWLLAFGDWLLAISYWLLAISVVFSDFRELTRKPTGQPITLLFRKAKPPRASLAKMTPCKMFIPPISSRLGDYAHPTKIIPQKKPRLFQSRFFYKVF